MNRGCSSVFLIFEQDILFDMSLTDLLLDSIRYCRSRSLIKYIDGANAQLEIIILARMICNLVRKTHTTMLLKKIHITPN